MTNKQYEKKIEANRAQCNKLIDALYEGLTGFEPLSVALWMGLRRGSKVAIKYQALLAARTALELAAIVFDE